VPSEIFDFTGSLGGIYKQDSLVPNDFTHWKIIIKAEKLGKKYEYTKDEDFCNEIGINPAFTSWPSIRMLSSKKSYLSLFYDEKTRRNFGRYF